VYVVTGGAGFIGSGVVRELNARGVEDILVVDDLTQEGKFLNLRGAAISDYMDLREFRSRIEAGTFDAPVEAVLHNGACTDTMERDGRYMLDNNFAYSKAVLHYALSRAVPLVYASSASVYGAGAESAEIAENEDPLNVYAYSKWLFDRYARRILPSAKSTVVGLRYFNVYGPRERHKGRMASMVYQLFGQLARTGKARLFEGSGGYADGEQRRDFVFAGDVAAVNVFFADGEPRRGIFNVGTGAARSFNDIVRALAARLGKGKIEYIPFPESLRGKYQSFTQADVSRLRAAGYVADFVSLEEGIARSVDAWREEQPPDAS